MAIPFFDGHNDTLLRLFEAAGPDKVKLFREGMPDAHIDLPRARAGNMAGGFFAIFPPDYRAESGLNAGAARRLAADLPPPLPPEEAQRLTLGMTALLLRLEQAGALALCRDTEGLHSAIGQGQLAALLHLEGAEAIDENLDMLEVLYAAGLRSLGLVWSRANVFACGVPFIHNADPDIGPGLSDAGRALVRACNQLGIMLDLSHLNAQGFRDVAALSDKPLVATHSNVHAISPHARNLVDWQLAAIRESGGAVGLNFAPVFLRPDGQRCADTGIELMVRHIDALVETLGEDGVALGSDFDGTLVPAAIGDVRGVQTLLAALLEKGYGKDLVDKMAMGNWLNLLERTWR